VSGVQRQRTEHGTMWSLRDGGLWQVRTPHPIHVGRQRNLPTKNGHAALRSLSCATCVYQSDSSSKRPTPSADSGLQKNRGPPRQRSSYI